MCGASEKARLQTSIDAGGTCNLHRIEGLVEFARFDILKLFKMM